MRRQLLLLSLILSDAAAVCQTTQGLVTGRLLNSLTGRPIQGATVDALGFTSVSDRSGYYYLPLLSPGIYRVRVTAPGFQSQEVHELELRVAARLELDFRLRPLSDVWETGQYNSVFLPGSKTIVTFFGPDVDPSRSGSFDALKGRIAPLESTVSEVIGSTEINTLPLAGRDVYTMLVTQPGVTSDAATARGLGLSVNGQRPSASNYLLDGLENNNYLITGPLATVAPEAIQEYRVSTNNFSAEYGRTAGFLANAITRSGTAAFHGIGYFYLKNDALNANGFQENRMGAPRNPVKEGQPGFVIGGPVLKQRLFFSSSFEHFRSRSFQDPFTFTFPNTPALFNFAIQGRQSRQLLDQFRPPAVPNGNGLTGKLAVRAPASVNRALAIERLDYEPPGGKDHLTGRVIVSRLTRPDFIWSPYKDFISALNQNTAAVGISDTHTFRPSLTNEARIGYSNDDLHWNRAHPEIPTFFSSDGAVLPGSPAFYAYKNVNRSWELLDNLISARSRHLMTFGAGILLRSSDGYLTGGRDGRYFFDNIIQFALDSPFALEAALDRTALPAIQRPDSNRSYGYRQFFGFAQDTYKVSSRLTANYGIRYEYYGGPSNVGHEKDALIQLGSGANLAQKLVSAQLVKPAGSGDQQLFAADKKNWAVRAGAAYDLSGNARTLLRGGYGIFYDRPFDNLWQNLRNNSSIIPTLLTSAPGTDFLAPIASVLPVIAAGQVLNTNFPDLTLVDQHLRNGYVHSYFAGVQQRIADSLVLEVNALGSYGRRLITTDLVNRDFSTPAGRYNPNLPDIAYRANQGFSDYNALTAVLRYRTTGLLIQGSYSWSHAIDNQSDPLVGDFFNLTISSIQTNSGLNGRAAFSRQFDPSADRGNSDFDQRHNLVLFSCWNLPEAFSNSKFRLLFRNWTVGELAAFRSGFPYTVLGTTNTVPGGGLIINNRPNIIEPAVAVIANPVSVPGGKQLLNPAGFAEAAPGMLGNAGRNAFRGPGLYNMDFSLARSFGVRWLGESGRVTFRADAFNLLNHANLNNPDSLLADPPSSTFGIASFGRQGRQSGFPAVSPLNETPRQIQLSVRVAF